MLAGYREIGSPIHCYWKCKMAQPLGKSKFPKIINMKIHIVQQLHLWAFIPEK